MIGMWRGISCSMLSLHIPLSFNKTQALTVQKLSKVIEIESKLDQWIGTELS